MGGKLSPIIIIVLVLVVVAVGILIFGIATGTGDFLSSGNDETEETSTIKPVLSLDKDIDEDDSSSITITVTATTEDEEGIKEIVLPDGDTVMGSTVTYEVTENGTYEFTANAYNGESETASIKVTEIEEISATNPYVPDGFSVVNDNVDEGYVIEDEYGNQYVWIPVASGKLTRNTALDANYEESSTSATSLVNSVAKYYGFYIGRFECSECELDGELTAASMGGKTPWTNITYQDAVSYAESVATMFGYEDYSTSIVNSYAWDTILSWVDETYENYSSSTNYGNYSGTVYPTGITEADIVNNICDLAGNVREWTTEIYKNSSSSSSSKNSSSDTNIYRVVRGGSANLSRTPASHIGYAENTSDTYWGFRLILYK